MQEQKISCPQCQGTIVFDIYALLQGVQFACPQCGAAISLASESKDKVNDTMEKLNELKQKALKQQ